MNYWLNEKSWSLKWNMKRKYDVDGAKKNQKLLMSLFMALFLAFFEKKPNMFNGIFAESMFNV